MTQTMPLPPTEKAAPVARSAAISWRRQVVPSEGLRFALSSRVLSSAPAAAPELSLLVRELALPRPMARMEMEKWPRPAAPPRQARHP